MNINDLNMLLADGKHPLVRFTGVLSEIDYECFAEVGMIAAVVSSVLKHDFYEVTFDFSVAKEHNLSLQSHDWFLPTGPDEADRLGTIFEAKLMKEDYIVDHMGFMDDDELPFTIIDLEDESNPLSQYMRHRDLFPDPKPTYVEWLESTVKRVVQENRWPSTEKARAMDAESAKALVSVCVYNACCIAERFERAGRIVGNGHHFAQNMSNYVTNEFMQRWKDPKDPNPIEKN